ncbi:MAG TPA: sulfite exporter TauE/SafE family protein [Thermoanaerobaculia bacterium]|nr:sulfite exporter TauE/SafE family protein [Thermoanaerobaculia bacterium]
MSPVFFVIVFVAAFLAGSISAVAGFGIGSILTPVLGLGIGAKLAVAAASIPHLFGNALRLWTLRDRVDKEVLKTFGAMSAAGALAGALLHAAVSSHAFKILFGAALVVFGAAGVMGWTEHLRLGRRGAWVGGGVSGLLGGLFGNQGGVRAAAMLGFNVRKDVFVATAVAIALVVDGARMPVYAFSVGRSLLTVWPIIATAITGVVLGTLLGRSVLGRIPERWFRRIVSALLVVLGIAVLLSTR